MVTTRSSRTTSGTCSLEALPSELFISITSHLDFPSRLALSATNSKFRTLLLPGVFQCFKIISDPAGARHALEVAKKVGANVRSLYFYGTAEPNLPEDAYDEDSTAYVPKNKAEKDRQERARRLRNQEKILPDAAAELLSGQHFPNADKLFVKFDFNFENDEKGDDGKTNYIEGVWDSRDDLSEGNGMYTFTVQETTLDMVKESEDEFPWRRLMNQTWAAVSSNTNITTLTINPLIPKAVSFWFSEGWSNFLSRLESVDLQVWGGDNGAGWEVGTLEGYMYFVAQLDVYIFAHLSSTKHLRLACYEHGPIGSEWNSWSDTFDYNTFSLKTAPESDCLAQLEELRLEYVVVCPELVSFLESKGSTLKKVELYECFAAAEYPDIRLTWAAFFSQLVPIVQEAKQWTVFEISNKHPPPLTFKEWQRGKYPKEVGDKEGEADRDETDEIKAIREELKGGEVVGEGGKGKRLFLYGTLTDKYGDRWPSHDVIIERLKEGSDAREYERLMRVIEGDRSA